MLWHWAASICAPVWVPLNAVGSRDHFQLGGVYGRPGISGQAWHALRANNAVLPSSRIRSARYSGRRRCDTIPGIILSLPQRPFAAPNRQPPRASPDHALLFLGVALRATFATQCTSPPTRPLAFEEGPDWQATALRALCGEDRDMLGVTCPVHPTLAHRRIVLSSLDAVTLPMSATAALRTPSAWGSELPVAGKNISTGYHWQ